MGRRVAQHKAQVEQDSVLPTCSGHTIASAGFCCSHSTVIVTGPAVKPSGAFENLMAKRSPCRLHKLGQRLRNRPLDSCGVAPNPKPRMPLKQVPP
jgi:hypothetical protein